VTLEQLKTAIKTQLRAELASGSLAVSDLHDDSIAQWANEEADNVVMYVNDPEQYPTLIVKNQSFTLAAGSATLPSNLNSTLSITVGTTSRRARILDPDSFNKFDSRNFVLTASEDYPIVTIANGSMYVKPVSELGEANGYIDFIKTHPAIDASNPTLFKDVADNVLVQLILSRYYDFNELPEMAVKARQIAGGLANGNKQSNG